MIECKGWRLLATR